MGGFKIACRIVVVGLLVCFSVGRAESLEDLEQILSRYGTQEAFLSDPKAILEFRESLKLYMGEEDSFNEVFDAFIQQIRDVSTKVPGFAETAWKVDPQWKEKSYSFLGQFTGSGLEIKREPLSKWVTTLKLEVKSAASPYLSIEPVGRTAMVEAELSELLRSVNDLQKLRSQLGVLSNAEYQALPARRRAEYNREMGRNNTSQRLIQKENQIRLEASNLSAYLIHEVLSTSEEVNDRLTSDADIGFREVQKLKRPDSYADLLQEKGIVLPRELIPYLERSFPAEVEFEKAYKAGQEDIARFNKLPDPRLDADVAERLTQLQEQGVADREKKSHLDPDQAKRFDEWGREVANVRYRKQEIAKDFAEKNPLFFYELFDDPERGTLRLKLQGTNKLWFRPSPRPFIAFFAGRKKNECVGGATASGLTPRRFARAALKGAQTLFTEFDSKRMEGYLGLTPVRHSKTGETYDIVDVMSHAIKGDVVLTTDGKTRKITFFDLWVEQQVPSEGAKGLAIGNGNAVKQNVGGAEVVFSSPAYQERKKVGSPAEFEIADPLGSKISKLFPEGMYKGSMIFDGIKSDGTAIYELVKRPMRRKWSVEELNQKILISFLERGDLDDRHVVWKIAQENDITLKPIGHYRDQWNRFGELPEGVQRNAILSLENLVEAQPERTSDTTKGLAELVAKGNLLAQNAVVKLLTSRSVEIPSRLQQNLDEKIDTKHPQILPFLLRVLYTTPSWRFGYHSHREWAAKVLGDMALNGNVKALESLVAANKNDDFKTFTSLPLARLVTAGHAELKQHLLGSRDEGLIPGLLHLALNGDPQAKARILSFAPVVYSGRYLEFTHTNTRVARAWIDLVLSGSSEALRKLEEWLGSSDPFVKNLRRTLLSNLRSSLKQRKALLRLLRENPESLFLKSIRDEALKAIPEPILSMPNEREARRALISQNQSSSSCELLLKLFVLSAKP